MKDRFKALLKLSAVLAAIILALWINGIVQEHQRETQKYTVPNYQERSEETYKLELLAWSWSRIGEGPFVEAKGQVRNISNENLRNVTALVTFYDKDGNFITADQALIDFNPILPSQKSPFSVLETYNPAMARANIEFKFLMDGLIQTKRK